MLALHQTEQPEAVLRGIIFDTDVVLRNGMSSFHREQSIYVHEVLYLNLHRMLLSLYNHIFIHPVCHKLVQANFLEYNNKNTL